MARRWNPRQPRDKRGRFAKKGGGDGPSNSSKGDGPGVSRKAGPGTITLRASLRSATVQYGRTVPLIPGKVNVYGGVLFRIEKAGDKATFLERGRDRIVDKVASKIPKNKVGKVAEDLLRGQQSQVGGVTVGRQGGKRKTTSIRVSNSKNIAGKRVRGARKPRAPRQPRQKRVR
jgi:hypothetical protein